MDMGELTRTTLKRVYDRGPAWAQRVAAWADYRIASRVRAFRHRSHPLLQRGIVTFSVDFELAWAWQYARRKDEDPVAKGLREREQTRTIIRLFERYGIPATWATVGHLFLDHCERGANGLAHPAMPRLKPFATERWLFSTGDWYQNDPCTDVNRDPAWYAPDLVELLLKSPVGHEVACHSFSHIGFGRYCPPEVAAAEIDACRVAMAPWGLTPETLVFPANDAGNFATLAERGVKIVRAFPVTSANITLPVRRDDGLWAVHVSSAIDRGKGWSLDQRLTRLCGFVDAAIARSMAAHIWFHPSLPLRELEEVLGPLFKYCAEKRDRGLVNILTMRDLVRCVEKPPLEHRARE